MSILHAFCHHQFNSQLLTFIAGVCSEIPCSIFSRLAETSCLNFIVIQLTGCHMMKGLGVGNLGTDYYRVATEPGKPGKPGKMLIF